MCAVHGMEDTARAAFESIFKICLFIFMKEAIKLCQFHPQFLYH